MHTIIPVKRKSTMVFAVVMHEEGMSRVRNHDPAVVEGWVLQESFSKNDIGLLLIQQTDILICYEANQEEFVAKVKEIGSGEAVLKYLARHWEHRPGDVFGDGEHHRYADVTVES